MRKCYAIFFDTQLWTEKRVYSKFEAWAWLVANAKRNARIKLDIQVLMDTWRWNEKKVSLMFAWLQKKGMVIPVGDSKNDKEGKGVPGFGAEAILPSLINVAKKDSEAVQGAIFMKVKDMFLDWYRKHYGAEYYWEPKDSVALNELLTKIRFSRDRRGMGTSDDEMAFAADMFFKSVRDEWVQSHMTMTTLNARYNALVSAIRSRGYKTGMIERGNDIDKYYNDEEKWKR